MQVPSGREKTEREEEKMINDKIIYSVYIILRDGEGIN